MTNVTLMDNLGSKFPSKFTVIATNPSYGMILPFAAMTFNSSSPKIFRNGENGKIR